MLDTFNYIRNSPGEILSVNFYVISHSMEEIPWAYFYPRILCTKDLKLLEPLIHQHSELHPRITHMLGATLAYQLAHQQIFAFLRFNG